MIKIFLDGEYTRVFVLILLGFIVLSCLGNTAVAQYFSVTGSVGGSSAAILPQANVVALTRADTTLIQFGATQEDGFFVLHRLPPGKYILQVSHVGYQTVFHDFDIQHEDVDVGHIVLSMQINLLEEFVVTEDHLPFVIRGDTIEYNALAFLVRPQDMVEDLLRRLPGVHVNDDGTVIVHGKIVQNMLVESKNFFGKDPSIATRNLPADAIEKVQVYDKPSDRAELTGVPDGQDEKTINLTLTEEAKRGVFGQTTGGIGSKQKHLGHYFARISAFQFAPKIQLALIGSADNINQPGFSGRQLSSFMGAGNYLVFGQNQDGLSESVAAGINLNYDLGANTMVNASYFLADLDHRRESTVRRDQILGLAASALSEESNHRKTNNQAHTVVVNAEIRFAEGHDMVFRGNLSKAHSIVSFNDSEITKYLDPAPLNSATTTIDDDGNDLSGSARVTWRKRISDSGRSLILEGAFDMLDAKEATDLHSDRRFYWFGDLQTREEQRQEQSLLSSAFEQMQRLEFIQPLRSGRNIAMYLKRLANVLDQDKTYFDLVDGQNVRDPMLSQIFEQREEYWQSGTNLHFRSDDGSRWVSAEIKAQYSHRKGHISTTDRNIVSHYVHFLPSILGQWKFSGNGGILDMWYQTSINEPELRQLQPFVNYNHPLRIYEGNPTLTPEYQHDLTLGYLFLRPLSEISLGADIRMSYIRNNIVSVRTIDKTLRQRISTVNANEAWVRYGGLTFGMPFRRFGIKWNAGIDGVIETAPEIINGENNNSKVVRGRIDSKITYRRGNAIEVILRASRSYNRVRYSLNESLNQSYINSTINVDASWHFTSVWSMESSLKYRILDRDVFGAGHEIALLNLSLSCLFFGGRGNMQFQINDVLNQNQIVRFTSSATHLQEERILSLGRHVMLKLTYKPRLM